MSILKGMEGAGYIAGLVAAGLAVAALVASCGKKPVLNPDAKAVTTAREEARDQVNRDLAAITQRIPDLHPLARVELDTCSRGQDNWKTRDPYRSECHLRVAAAYTFVGELAPRVSALQSVLTGRGWTNAGTTTVYRQGTPTPPDSQSLGDMPRTLRIHLTSADQPEAEQFRGIAADMADEARIRSHGLGTQEYHRTLNGTPWGEPWRTARRPGTRLMVLTFQENYARN